MSEFRIQSEKIIETIKMFPEAKKRIKNPRPYPIPY